MWVPGKFTHGRSGGLFFSVYLPHMASPHADLFGDPGGLLTHGSLIVSVKDNCSLRGERRNLAIYAVQLHLPIFCLFSCVLKMMLSGAVLVFQSLKRKQNTL